jgi:deoxyadenosine/deoxycytidine kinase
MKVMGINKYINHYSDVINGVENNINNNNNASIITMLIGAGSLLIIGIINMLFKLVRAPVSVVVINKPIKLPPIIISIEGNIGTGKSTLIEKIQEHFKSHKCHTKIGYITEPVDIWSSVTDEHGVTILEKYYEDQYKYAFPFQMMAYISRLSIIRKALHSDYDVIIMERSIFTDKEVFAKMLYDEGKIEAIEYNIYMKWFNEFIGDIPKIAHIYIQADPNISAERVVKRGRQGEKIPLSYLEKCHQYHEDWLMGKGPGKDGPMLILDGNKDRTEGDYNMWLDKIETTFLHL